MAKLSANYAAALFELAVEDGAENDFLEQAVLLRDLFKDAGARRVLVHPHIPAAEKRSFFGEAFAGKLHKDLLSFIFLVVDKNRENYLLPALSDLILLIERRQRKTTAKVVSAEAPDGKRIAALKKLLEQKLNKQVEITVKANPAVIGGPYIQVDGYFIDRTVKRRLRDMTADMKERCGA